jgi:large subunit ribosomal protein L3
MGRKQGSRRGSMQVWPRKRAEKFLPRVNWTPILSQPSISSQKPNLLSFIGYKAGMASAFVKDNTPDSMTKNKRTIVPVTIIECPTMKILSVRFHKNNKIVGEVLNDNLDKELIRIVRMPKAIKKAKEMIEKMEKEAKFDDVTVVIYSQPKKADIKKTPDITETGLSGSLTDKLNFKKENIGKEISINEVFTKGVVDIRGLTIGKGFQGSVKRFGIKLRHHKSEKGQRVVGSVGAWHPIGIRFNVPRAGQLGMFTRIAYNHSIVAVKKFTENDAIAKRVFNNFGIIRTDYLVLAGSVQGSKKRQLLITSPLRATKKQAKKNYELIELR